MMQDGWQDKVDTLFSQWNTETMPGCALGIIKNGDFIFKKGYGLANLDTCEKIDATTCFELESASKQFTAACIAILASEGKLSFDDDIRNHCPEFPEYDAPMTIRHLIYHTSGLRHVFKLMRLSNLDDTAIGKYSSEELVALLARQKQLNFSPGERYEYNGSNYFLLGQIVERCSGQTLADFAQDRIFAPLKMHDTYLFDAPSKRSEKLSQKYHPLGEKFRKQTGKNAGTYVMGGKGVVTNVEDLLKWDDNLYDDKLTKTKNLNTTLMTQGSLNNGLKFMRAMGIDCHTYMGFKSTFSTGGDRGYTSEIRRFPDLNFSVICLSNCTAPVRHLATAVADTCLALQFNFQRFEGSYFCEDLQVTHNIVLKDHQLFLTNFPNAPTAPLKASPRSQGFDFGVEDITLSFSLSENERAESYIMQRPLVKGLQFHRAE